MGRHVLKNWMMPLCATTKEVGSRLLVIFALFISLC